MLLKRFGIDEAHFDVIVSFQTPKDKVYLQYYCLIEIYFHLPPLQQHPGLVYTTSWTVLFSFMQKEVMITCIDYFLLTQYRSKPLLCLELGKYMFATIPKLEICGGEPVFMSVVEYFQYLLY